MGDNIMLGAVSAVLRRSAPTGPEAGGGGSTPPDLSARGGAMRVFGEQAERAAAAAISVRILGETAGAPYSCRVAAREAGSSDERALRARGILHRTSFDDDEVRRSA